MTPEKFLVEASLMRNLSDANVVCLLGVLTQDEPYLIITEFMDGGDLLTFLLAQNEADVELPRRGEVNGFITSFLLDYLTPFSSL